MDDKSENEPIETHLLVGGSPTFLWSAALIFLFAIKVFYYFDHPEYQTAEDDIDITIWSVIAAISLIAIVARVSMKWKYGIFGCIVENPSAKLPDDADKMVGCLWWFGILTILFLVVSAIPDKYLFEPPEYFGAAMWLIFALVITFGLKKEFDLISRLTSEQKQDLKIGVGIKYSDIAPINRI